MTNDDIYKEVVFRRLHHICLQEFKRDIVSLHDEIKTVLRLLVTWLPHTMMGYVALLTTMPRSGR